MGKPSLILAALAADAMPGLRFTQVQDLTEPGSEIVTQLLTTDDGRQVLFKSPRSAAALTSLGLEVRALRVLRQVQLPFQVPSFIGETSPKAVYRALAFEYISGNSLDVSRIKVDDPITARIGQTLAQIHSIPPTLVAEAGLPEFDPALKVRERVAEFDRAMETGRIHPDLLERWQSALLDVNLFRYQPTVVHGNFTSDNILVNAGEVVGINSWTNLSIDDPAVDLAGIYSEFSTEIAEAVTSAYESSIRADRNIRQRATLYFELSLANFLLQAVDSQDEDNIAQAQALLDSLHEYYIEGQRPSLSPSPMALPVEEVVTPISQAASFTAPITVITEQIEVVAEEESTTDTDPKS